MRVLITNNTLADRAGSELYARDLAIGLMRLGHQPVCYSTHLGAVAEELRLATVPVLDDLRHLQVPPDLIHGQHHLDAMTAMARFPAVPAVYVCHGWLPWEEWPPTFPSIRHYIAVDDLCLERLLTTPGISGTRTSVQYNFVDLDRFRPRPALPDRPRAALVFSNNAGRGDYLDQIIQGCQAAGITQVDVAGMVAGRVTSEPERVLLEYDVVFAKGRCALEAMATGAAVVVADEAGLAGLVTTGNVDRLRRLNFGRRTMQASRVTPDGVRAAVYGYDAQDAAAVAGWIRQQASMTTAIARLVGIYEGILARPQVVPTDGTVATATSDYLRTLAAIIKDRHQALAEAHAARQHVDALQRELRAAREAAERGGQAGQP